jgi:hypothetical protein
MSEREEQCGKDPFTGTWVYRPERSKSTGPKQERWVQWIEATADGLRLREEVVVATGQRTNVSIEAKFDGRDYPVTRSSLSDTIAYTRKGRRKIIGTGKKNGGVTLRETIAVAGDDETLTLTFGIFEGGRQVMGFAVFDRVE